MTSPSNPGASAPNAGSAGFCAACGASLSAGSRFCHRCGTPVGQGVPLASGARATPGGIASVLPWGVAFVALLALVAAFAGKNFGSARGSSVDGSANALPTSAIDGQAGAAGAGAPGAPGAPGSGPAPDISNLSPSERAGRLYNRVMAYAEAGMVDSVAMFAPMAIASHEMLSAPTEDERYHFGRIGEVTGSAEVAKAQADTILRQRPTSLLGLLLASRAARMGNDAAAAKAFDARLLAALESELATKLQDYELHRPEIDRAASEARSGSTSGSRR